MLLLTWGAMRCRQQAKVYTTLQLVCGSLLCCATLLLLLLPPVAESQRAYYKDRNQYEWASDLNHEDADRRQAAVVALCHMLKSAEPGTKRWIIQELGQAGPTAREALPILRDLANSEDPIVKEQARIAIKQISSSKRDKSNFGNGNC